MFGSVISSIIFILGFWILGFGWKCVVRCGMFELDYNALNLRFSDWD